MKRLIEMTDLELRILKDELHRRLSEVRFELVHRQRIAKIADDMRMPKIKLPIKGRRIA